MRLCPPGLDLPDLRNSMLLHGPSLVVVSEMKGSLPGCSLCGVVANWRARSLFLISHHPMTLL